MGLFSFSYEPGGQHHVRITDGVFNKARTLVSSDEELKARYKEAAAESGCAKYAAHDFPVADIIGAFFLSYELQEEASGVPASLRIGNIQLGRKDQVEYNKFVDRFNRKIQEKIERREATAPKGLGGMLVSMAAGAAANGVAKAVTGKSESVRAFEKNFANYICGDSQTAKDYILGFATEFGGDDEGVVNVAKAIRTEFWVSEFAKSNRS